MTSRLRRRRVHPVLLGTGAAAVLAVSLLAGVGRAADATEPSGTTGSGVDALAGLSAGDLLNAFTPVSATAVTDPTAPDPAAVAAASPLAAGVLTPDPSGIGTEPYTDCSNTTGVPYATGLPPLPCLLRPYQVPGTASATTAYTDNGALYDDITTLANKAALRLQLPMTVARIFSVICLSPIGDTPAQFPCPPEYGFTYPTDPSVQPAWLGVGAAVFLQSPLTTRGGEVDPTSPQFGVVTQLRVHVLAFGSIPGEATVTVRQRIVDGYVQPIKLTLPSLTPLYEPGTVVNGYERFGPNPGEPSDPNSGLEQLVDDAVGTGDISISVSDVTIDDVPLDVGSTCGTDTTLHVYARGGWFNSAESAQPNEPAEYRPFLPPGYLHAGVITGYDGTTPQITPGIDIPAFSGCVGSTGEDVSPLITGLVSSLHNQLDLTQVTAFKAFGCLTVEVASGPCLKQHPAVVPPAKVVLPSTP